MIVSSLATILWKWFNMRSLRATNLIDRCPLFVGKDRPLRNKLFKVTKKVIRLCLLSLTNRYRVNAPSSLTSFVFYAMKYF